MYRKCCVPKCNNLRKDVKLHQFPAKEEIRSKWLKCLSCESIGQNIKGMFICHDHFEQKFVNVQTNRLRSDAYPSLFTDLEITSGKPSKAFKETENVDTHKHEHSYASKRIHYDHNYYKTDSSGVQRNQLDVVEKEVHPDENESDVITDRHTESGHSSNDAGVKDEVEDTEVRPEEGPRKHVKVKCPDDMTASDIISDLLTERSHSPEDLYDADVYGATETEMSMYDDEVQVIEKPSLQPPATLADKNDLHEGIVCNVCENEVFGFRYVCVECGDWDLCEQCEARAAHPQHYVLRVPHSRHDEIQRVIEAVRQTVRQTVRGELMTLQLEVTADEQGRGAHTEELDEDNKDDIDLTLGLCPSLEPEPHYPRDPLGEDITTIGEEWLTADIDDGLVENIYVGTDLRVTPEKEMLLPETNDAVNITEATRSSEHSALNRLPDRQPIVDVDEEVDKNFYVFDGTDLRMTPGKRKSLPQTQHAANINNATRTNEYSSLNRLQGQVYCQPTRVTSETTDILAPDDDLIEGDDITMKPLEETPHPTDQQFRQTTSTQIKKKSSFDLEYINIQNIDNATFFLHQEKLLGLAKVKLKRLSEMEVVSPTKRPRTTDTDSDEFTGDSS